MIARLYRLCYPLLMLQCEHFQEEQTLEFLTRWAKLQDSKGQFAKTRIKELIEIADGLTWLPLQAGDKKRSLTVSFGVWLTKLAANPIQDPKGGYFVLQKMPRDEQGMNWRIRKIDKLQPE